jgi:outer membrane protein OmpA-like peptidoglycan-associated protein
VAPEPAPAAAPEAPSLPPEAPPAGPSPSSAASEPGLLPPPDAEEVDGALSAAGDPEAEYAEEQRARRAGLPSLTGSIGLLRLSTAEAGARGQFRLGLRGEYASKDSFIVEDDQNRRMMGGLTFGFTPVESLEIFGGIVGGANRNRRGCTTRGGVTTCRSEEGRVDPEIIRSFGDILLGGKYAASVSDGFSLGGELGVRLLASNAGLAFEPSATSVWGSALGTVDLRRTTEFPLRLHLNAGYYVDNSSEIQDFSGVTSINSRAVSSFAYGIGRNRIRTAVGLDTPIADVGGADMSVQPFVEYHFEYVTAAPDRAFDRYRPPLCRGSSRMAPTNALTCSDNRDQHWLTFGIRTQIGGGLDIDLGVDLAMRHVGYPYGSPLLPYNVVFGLAYPFDFGASGPPKVVTRTVTVEKVVERAQASKEGVVVGKVVSSKGEPIGGAVIGVKGMERSRVASESDGTFATKPVPPGLVALEISAPNFQPAVVQANVLVGQTAQIAATLQPRDTKTKLVGRVVDEAGKPVAASVIFDGPEKTEITTDPDGTFSATLTAGTYTARAEAPRFAPAELPVTLVEGTDRSIELKLGRGKGPALAALGGARAAAPARTGPAAAGVVSIQGKRIVVRRPVTFRAEGPRPTAALAGGSARVVDQVAQALATRPEIRRVRVEAHWDGTVDKGEAEAVTQQQAQAIAALLAKRGLGPDRVEAIGMGAKRPLVPNIGPMAVKNRRVEFYVVD